MKRVGKSKVDKNSKKGSTNHPGSFKNKKGFKKSAVKGASEVDEVKHTRPSGDHEKMIARKEQKKSEGPRPSKDGAVRLNKYLANAGVCSRREADKIIETGVVEINGKIVSELGTKVYPGDEVHYGGQRISPEKSVYILINKPKDFITTVDDPQGRKTVLSIVEKACKERIYPVGRLDRQTTGLLIMTNDGDLTKRLTHPKHHVKKIYHVQTEKNITLEEMHSLLDGVKLDDGQASVDTISYVGDGKDKKQVGVELHSGKNRVIRRMFEHIGHNVIKLDRVAMAGLTKKNLPRGKWRFLTNEEVINLKRL